MESSDDEIYFGGIPSDHQSTPKATRVVGKRKPQENYDHYNIISQPAHEASISLNLSSIGSSFLLQPSLPPSLFKTPVVTTNLKKRKPKFTCTYCLKGYLCHRSFQNHVRNHVIQDAAARFPNVDDILGSILEIAEFALTRTVNAPTAQVARHPMSQLFGEMSTIATQEEWCEFCTELGKHLVGEIVHKKCMLPSALMSSLMDSLHSILSDCNLCQSLMNTLPLSATFDDDVKSKFFLEFALNFVSEIFSFISKTFRTDPMRIAAPKTVQLVYDEDCETIYYIGGSIIRGYIKMAFRNQSSHSWSTIGNVLKTKMLCETPSSSKDAACTRSIDRGGLLYLNDKCQLFLIAVAKVIFNNERNDGSIDYDKVIKTVSESSISVTWDEMILNSLPENMSVGLMYDIIRCFCRTCGRGFAKRRLNALRGRPLISMPTRHAVASRRTQ